MTDETASAGARGGAEGSAGGGPAARLAEGPAGGGSAARLDAGAGPAARSAGAAGELAGRASGRRRGEGGSGVASPLSEYLDSLPDLVLLIQPEGLRIVDVRPRRGPAFGHEPAALVGRSLAELVPGLGPGLVDDYLAGRHDPHPDTPLRVVVRSRGGAETPADLRFGRAPDGALVAVVRHVSESARVAEREIVVSVCASPMAIVTWELEGGRIVSFNPAAERLYGLGAAEALGRPVASLAPASARGELAEAEARLRAGEAALPREVRRLSGDTEIAVEETLFLMRDVCGHAVRVGSFARELGELVGLRRAAEVLSAAAPSAAEAPAAAGGGAMGEVYAAAAVAADDGEVTVLLLGETGVGKSYFARRIHAKSARWARPFLEINCAGFEPQLLESELFGHERGAFTGATHPKRGLVEAASGGTLFLDEVAELPAPAQAKLLLFLDERTFRRVGGEANLRADVRVVAATNADLGELARKGAFRRDLYYRLSVLPITIPPLRERRAEIAELATAIVRELRPRAPASAAPLAREVASALTRYAWPGNLRELRNALERALIVGRGEPIELRHLPPEISGAGARPAGAEPDETLAAVERAHVRRVLDSVGGNHTLAARVLGISRSTLNRKLAAWKDGPGGAAG
ncbi:MAG TPA: sigma 54-interacting transcriptional regulator [Polyangiaceae bacterium]|nr:sigma 54-interacting transcriptional regulator [Polyangiaceae bacterium]